MIEVEDVNRMIADSRVRSWWNSPRPMIVASVLLGFLVIALLPEGEGWPQTVGLILPWLLLGVILAYSWWANRQQTRQSRQLARAVECVQLENATEAEKILLDLLSRPMRDPYARLQAILALAAITELQQNSPAAQAAYEGILADDDKMPWQDRLASVGLAWSMLNNHQLADAVNLLDKLAVQDHPDSIAAYYELVALYREVLMGQAQAACESEDQRRTLFRENLSTRAAYGYGLLAAAWDRSGNPDRAAACWRDATLLMSTKKLTDRFDLLGPLAERYPAVESPI